MNARASRRLSIKVEQPNSGKRLFMLENRNAVIYRAGGAIGGAIARAFAGAGARVFLSGVRLGSVQPVARDIVAAGGTAEAAEVDALDEKAVERHVASVVEKTGGIDICVNAVGLHAVQGTSLVDLSLKDFNFPINTWTSTQFLTSRASARHMIRRRKGVILTLGASPARLAIPLAGGFGVACAAIEALSRTLAAELGPHGIRVVCVRPHRIADSGLVADPRVKDEAFRAHLESMTLLKRLPTLAEVAQTAVFLASDHAAAMTGTVANLTCGMIAD
jgi:3-oxoacyl-[acyl-carrier protein] reductase